MSNDAVNTGRRRFLAAATSVVGAAGAVGVAVPFVGSWNPSAKAKAAGAPVKADISKIEAGAMKVFEWRGKPVYVVRRTEAQIAELPQLDTLLKDPESGNADQPAYTQGVERAIKPEIMVLVGLCTHLGCAPKYRPEVGAVDFDADWKGGFFCPCHGSRFDTSGRVFTGSPADKNLVIPPYRFESDNVIVIGEDQEVA